MDAIAYALANGLTGTYFPVVNESKLNCPVNISTYGGFGSYGSSRSAFSIGDKGYYLAQEKLYMYDSTLNTWTQKANNPNTNRVNGYTADSFVINGKGYIIGGGKFVSSISALDGVEMYDPVNNIWATKASLPVARYALACVSSDSFGYILGSYDSNVCLKYSPVLNTWVNIGIFAPYYNATLSIQRIESFKFADVGAYLIYSCGSYSFGKLYYYDFSLDTFTSKLESPTKINENPGYILGNKLRILGGSNDSGVATSAVYEYDIPTNVWATGFSPLPSGVKDCNPLFINNGYYTLMGTTMKKYVAEHVIINGLDNLKGYLATI